MKTATRFAIESASAGKKAAGLNFKEGIASVATAEEKATIRGRVREVIVESPVFDLGKIPRIVIQPVLGQAADAWGYPASCAAGAAFQALAIPFLWFARRERARSDTIAG